METEVRYYYSSSSKDKIINYFKRFNELEYKGRYYEVTDQYNHPMEEFNFYDKKIDGRFRVRKTIGDNISKCMITWKRRLESNNNELVHKEEEIEVSILPDEYDNLCLLLTKVLHLTIVESYERYRYIFSNNEVEVVVDEYPFGIAIEIENKSKDIDADKVISKYLDLFKFDINNAYRLSWDDKYAELCNKQNKTIESIVRFDKDMPIIKEEFNL